MGNKSILMGLLLIACKSDDFEEHPMSYSVNDHNILVNGEILEIRGIVYIPGYPGYLPWEIENSTNLSSNLKNSILDDIAHIKELGANTIRLWGAPEYCYQAVKEVGDLHILQTLWVDGEQSDFFDSVFVENTKNYFRDVINRIYGVFENKQAPVCSYIIGNELSELSIINTNQNHPEITSYTGDYIMTDSSLTASEVFLAQMGDYVKSYIFENYGTLPLVTYSNDIRTDEVIDTPIP